MRTAILAFIAAPLALIAAEMNPKPLTFMDTGRVMEAASKSMALTVIKATIKLETFTPIAITTVQPHAQEWVSFQLLVK